MCRIDRIASSDGGLRGTVPRASLFTREGDVDDSLAGVTGLTAASEDPQATPEEGSEDDASSGAYNPEVGADDSHWPPGMSLHT